MSFSLPAYTCNINETFAALFNCKIVLTSGTAIIILIHSQNYCCYISLVMFNAPFSKTLLLQVLLVTFTHTLSLFQPFTIKGSIGIVIKIIFFLENIHSPMFILGSFLVALNFFLEIPVWNLKKKTFYLSVNVLSRKVLIRDTIFTSPTGDRTAILHGHSSHMKV